MDKIFISVFQSFLFRSAIVAAFAVSLASCELVTPDKVITENFFKKYGCPSVLGKPVSVPPGRFRLVVATNPPGLNIYVGGVYVGQSPVDKFVPSVGVRQVDARINGFLENISGFGVDFSSGGSRGLQYDFNQGFRIIHRALPRHSPGACVINSKGPHPPSGKTLLFLTTYPEGANVFINDRLVGQTPFHQVVNPSPGLFPVRVTASSPGTFGGLSRHSATLQTWLLSSDTVAIQEVLP